MTIWQEDVHNGSWASLGENSHTSTEPGSLGVVVTQEAQIAGLDILHEHCMFYRIGSESDYCVQYFPRQLIFFFHYLRSFVHRWIKNGSKHSQQACLTISFFLSFNFLILFSCLISASWLITPAHIMITRSHTHILHKHTQTQSSLGSRCG